MVSDVCFAEKASIGGFVYFVTFLDVFTHFAVVFMLRKKSEVFEKFKEYEAMASTHFGSRIRSFLCDNGREFVNGDFLNFCKEKGIRVVNTVAYNHQQNGRAERLNRTLEDRARSMLQASGLPKTFWSEAILCATYLLNRSPTSATNKIPAEEWYQKSVELGKLRTFGCVCYIHVPDEKRQKFDSKSCKGIMVGYAPIGYRVYNLETQSIQIARNMIFDESKLYKDLFKGEFSAVRDRATGDSDEEDDVAETTTSNSMTEDAGSQPGDGEEAPLRRSSRERKPPAYLSDYEVSANFAEAFLVENPKDPKWDEAKRRELNSMKNFDVWNLVPRPAGVKVLRSKWVLQQKPDKCKARLVAVGYDEKEVPDLLFSPVVNMTSVKILLSIVVQKRLALHQMDVSNAFLHGDIDYKVYMEQPPGYQSGNNLVCELKCAIYGLKVAPRLWNKCINDFMVSSLNFSRSDFDHCFYFKVERESCMFVLIYVDDLLLASDSDELIKTFKVTISRRCNIVNLGVSKRFLGMEIDYNVQNQMMTLSQAQFIDKVASRFNVTGAKKVYTPIEVDLQLEKSEDCNVDLPFRQLVGCLLYISIISRPDISFAVHYFSRFMNAYSSEHFSYLKRVLVYLVHTKHLKLTYTASSLDGVLECFVDADWAADHLDRKSTSGSVVRLFHNVISWSSKKQACITLSSTESEYVSLSSFVHDVLFWITGILKEFQVEVPEPILIFEDNQAVIHLSKNPITSKRSKHIDVRYKYVKELVLEKKIHLVYTATADQAADGFTKALVRVKFESFRRLLRVA